MEKRLLSKTSTIFIIINQFGEEISIEDLQKYNLHIIRLMLINLKKRFLSKTSFDFHHSINQLREETPIKDIYDLHYSINFNRFEEETPVEDLQKYDLHYWITLTDLEKRLIDNS